MGPLDPAQHPKVHISRFGVIPKNHQPGKWRLIVDLSHPKGESVNDGIEPEVCSLQCTSVDEAVRVLSCVGPQAMMAKFVIESCAYSSSRQTALGCVMEWSALCGYSSTFWPKVST